MILEENYKTHIIMEWKKGLKAESAILSLATKEIRLNIKQLFMTNKKISNVTFMGFCEDK